MIKVVREVFGKAIIVIDRFHIRKLINEMIWWVKTRLKVKIANQEDKKGKKNKKSKESKLDLENKEANKEANKEGEKKCKKNKKRKNSKYKQNYKPKRYENWETLLEMIVRSHYQIRKNKKDWTDKENKRWSIISKIQTLKSLVSIYEVSSKLYDIYEMKISKEEWIKLMDEFIKLARRYKKIPELLHLANTIEKRIDHITNYFVSRHTNWFAEWLNSRIWNIVRDSRWFINNDYMIFRLTSAL